MATYKQIIERNVDLMNSSEAGGMRFLLFGESIGGNAGCLGKLSCACANFYYDAQSGLIAYFGNYQEVPEEIRKANARGRYVLALVSEKELDNNDRRIVAWDASGAENNYFARLMIRMSAEKFNSEFGFSFEYLKRHCSPEELAVIRV